MTSAYKTSKTRIDIKLWPSGCSFSHAIAMYLARYNDLEQLHMQVLLNSHWLIFTQS